MQLLKKAEWFPWINSQTDRANRLIAVALAGLAALGISFTFDAGTGVMTVAGLKLETILGGGWAWLKSYATQEFIYRASAKKNGGNTAAIVHNEPDK